MDQMKIIIAGGTGFIGQAICNYFGTSNEIVVLSRQVDGQLNNSFGENSIIPEANKHIRYVKWDGKTIGNWAGELEGAALVINLTGKTVNCRYTEKNKRAILESRVDATNIIGLAIKHCVVPPKLWINASSATIYAHATDTARDESYTIYAKGFSEEVCKAWEAAFYDQRTPFTRKIALRMAITLGPGGIMKPYFNLVKFGLGGKQGSGKQMYTWIHVEDTCRMIEWLYDHKELEGNFNCCSPNAVSNNEFMRTIRKATGAKFGLPAMKWMLKLGAWIIGTETELVLKSRWVLPTRILETGFVFKYPELGSAMKAIISKTARKRYQLF